MNAKTTTKNGRGRSGNFGNQAALVASAEPALDFSAASPSNRIAGDLAATPVLSAKLLLTVRECANMTSLSEKTILRLIQRGKLRCLSSIRHKRIPAAELARFVREN